MCYLKGKTEIDLKNIEFSYEWIIFLKREKYFDKVNESVLRNERITTKINNIVKNPIDEFEKIIEELFQIIKV